MRGLLSKVIIASVLGLLSYQIYPNPEIQNVEYGALDFWFSLRQPVAPPEDVILVAIDEASYDALNVPMSKGWPRELHAKLLERLAKAGVKRVVFDIIFSGPSGDPEADEALAKAFGLLPTAIGVEFAREAQNMPVKKVHLPYEPFLKTVGELALVKKPLDGEYVRRFKTGGQSDLTNKYRSLAEAAANLPPGTPEPDTNDLIWFYGPANTIISYPYVDVLEEFIPDEELKGKVVFVGLALQSALGPSQKDAFLTSFQVKDTPDGVELASRTFGVEIHATAALNLIHQEWIHRYSTQSERIVFGTATFVVALIFFYLSPGLGILALFLFICGWAAFSYSEFLNLRFIPGVTLVGIIAPSIYLVSTIFSYLTARKKQRQTEEAFSHYLSPEMAREVSQNPDALNLGGETITATALFTDIADFTKISETMAAEEVVQMLNEYFTEVMDAIFETRGTLIKFIGDAVFALWGAPVHIKDHELQTVKTALAIREKVKEFNATKKYPELHTRIGVHTGPMVVGNLGSRKRFDYTAIGDSVNLAARLEGLNKYFGTDFLFSKNVEEKLPESLRICTLGRVAVKGKSEVVEVSTVLSEDIPNDHEQIWKEALLLFHHFEWDKSEQKFKELLIAKSYFMKSAQLYLQQIPYRKITGTDDWQGEISFEVK